MDIMEVQGKRGHLTTLHTGDGLGNGPIEIGCGVYEEVPGRDEWTEESIRGQIPTEALIKWGLERGFLQFVQLR